MTKYEDVEKAVREKYEKKDKKKRPAMRVSGKSVFKLQTLILKKNDSSSQRKHS